MPKILLIDDDQTLSTIFLTAFKQNGLETVYAATGDEGIKKAKGEKIDLIILDQVLPDGSGNDILKKLKEDPQTQKIPVIMFSNFSQEELVNQAINAGALDYVFKYQVEPIDLVNKVKRLLEHPEGGQTKEI